MASLAGAAIHAVHAVQVRLRTDERQGWPEGCMLGFCIP